MDKSEEELWKQFNDDLGIYRDKRNAAIEELKKDRDSGNTAIDNLQDDVNTVVADINKLIETSQALAKNKDSENASVSKRTIIIMDIIAAISFIIAIAMGLVLSNYISRAVNRGLQFAESLGDGDLRFDLDFKESDDELGKLIKALKEAQEKIKHTLIQVAEESNTYVEDIQKVVGGVETAFGNLSSNANEVLKFINERVTKDYDLLVETGVKYEEDAAFVSNLSQETAAMSEELNASAEEINSVIQNVANSMNHASGSSEDMMTGMRESLAAIDEISAAAVNQAAVAEKLNNLIQLFRI